MAQNNENGSNGNIPDDLVLFILSKLPLKSLKRFACVKKSWLYLFDNPIFMSMFRPNFISNCHYGKDSSLLLRKQLPKLWQDFYPHELIWISGERFGEKVNLGQFEPPLTYRYFNLTGFGSGIHGIICIFLPGWRTESSFILWNPATEESLIIPPSLGSSDVPNGYHEIVPCGFGYDHVGNDYKIIRCIYIPELYNIWEIYSVRSNTWRKLDINIACANPFSEYSEYTRDHVYLNGVCHWKAFREMHLVSFNLNTEEALMTPYPLDKRDDRMDVILDVLNGSISLISNENNSICISILGEIGVEESWTKLFTFGPLPCNFKSLSAVGNKGDILYIKKEDHELASFDLSTQMVEEIDVKGNMLRSRIIIYKESLLPIRGINN